MEDRQAREICLARNPRSGGEISWAVRLRPSSPRRSRDPARIHDKTRTPGTHLSRKASWPSTFTRPALRPQRLPPLRHRSESQQREKHPQHPSGTPHRAPPARSTRTGPAPCGLRHHPPICPPAWGTRAHQATQRSELRRSTRLARRGDAGPESKHERIRPAKASAARRREGSKPKGRDGDDGTGRSPRAWRRRAPTRSPRRATAQVT